jgi:signal transduction histidine kinase
MTTIQNHFEEDRAKKLQSSANMIAGSVAKSKYFDNLADESRRTLQNTDLGLRSAQDGYRVMILDNYCTVLNDTNNEDVNKTRIVPEVIKALQFKNAVSVRDDARAIYASASIDNDAGEAVGAVLLISSLQDIYGLVSDINQKLLMYTTLTAVIMGVLVVFASQMLIDPLTSILSVVTKMSDGNLDERVELFGHDEYAVLGQACNVMAAKLQQMDKTRHEFVSNVSHELKTPLASVKVLSESILLQNDVQPEVYREFLQDINSEVDRLVSVVNDLLQLVKLDQGEMGLQVRSVSLNRLIGEIIFRLQPLARQKDLTLKFDYTREVTVECDEVKFASAISNLVDNAVKYTPAKGAVVVTLEADHQNAFISVADTGIGIAEEDQRRIFDRFYRVDKTRDRETGGTGLGLAITYSTVRMHRGSIKIASKENEGSIFTVRVPIHFKGDEA